MRIFFIAALVLSGIVLSCSGRKSGVITVDLTLADYTDVISASGTIQAVNTTPIMATADYFGEMKAAWAIPEGSKVEKGDTLCILECSPLMQLLDQQMKGLESLQADFKKLEADNAMNMAMLDASMKENLAAMSIAQLDSVQIQFAPRVRQELMALELEKARIGERKLKKKYDASKKIDESEIRQLKSRIQQLESSIQTFRSQVDGLVILAPKRGIVTAAEMQGRMIISFGDGDPIEIGGYPKPGSMIFPEMPLMQLPELESVQILVKLQEVDYKRIEKGMKVDIRVDARDQLRTTGSVLNKSLTGKSDYDSKVKWYEVVVAVDSCHLDMPPGMSARCDIFVGLVRDTVVVPTISVFERDSMKVVYVEEKGRFRAVAVETGLNNSSQTIVTKGLTGRETISLVEPPQNLIRKPKQKTNE